MSPNAQQVKLMRPGGIPYDLPAKRPLSIDGVQRRGSAPAPARPKPQATPRVINDFATRKQPKPSPAVAVVRPETPDVAQPQPADTPAIARAEPVYRSHKPSRTKRSLWRAGQWILIGATAVVGSLLSQALMLGGLAIAIYAVCAWLLPIKSERTFGLALAALVATALTLSLNGESLVAKNFATYTFLLMAVGVISLTLESRKKNSQIYRRIA